MQAASCKADFMTAYQKVNSPKNYYRKGRIFLVLWPEPVGVPDTERMIYWKIRRFVVIRPRNSYCLCLPIRTYQGKATSKAGVSAQEHAAIVPLGGEAQYHPDEQTLKKTPLYVKIEDASLRIDPMSRLNFAKVSTLEYSSMKVRNVGRVDSQSIKLLEQYFSETLQIEGRLDM